METEVLRLIVDISIDLGRRQCMEHVVSTIRKVAKLSSTTTGHGKAQRQFANRLLETLGEKRLPQCDAAPSRSIKYVCGHRCRVPL